MALDDLEEMEAALIGRLTRWVLKARVLIGRHVEDAKAHALNALTQTVRDTPDGRATTAKLDKSRSKRAAIDHLDSLCGELSGMVRDARAKFYRESIKLWLPFIPEADRDPHNASGNPAVERVMVDAVIGGYTLAMRLDPAIATAKRTLSAQLNMGSLSDAKERRASASLGVWQRQTELSLSRTAESILSDSQTAIHEATGWLLIHPDKRGQRLVDPGAGLAFPKDA